MYNEIEYKLLMTIRINLSRKIIALASSFDDNQFDVKYLKRRHWVLDDKNYSDMYLNTFALNQIY